jgi:hypothetical protein
LATKLLYTLWISSRVANGSSSFAEEPAISYKSQLPRRHLLLATSAMSVLFCFQTWQFINFVTNIVNTTKDGPRTPTYTQTQIISSSENQRFPPTSVVNTGKTLAKRIRKKPVSKTNDFLWEI